MADVELSRAVWDGQYDWSQRGEEWSAWCGGSRTEWFSVLLPRIQAFLPTQTILEIAPGYGRWTQYLLGHCERLVGVDLSNRCVQHCRERFASAGADFHINDGRSLDMVADGSIDFVFSFGSLVHAEDDVLRSYLTQLTDKLTDDGVGFVHHSNAGAYRAVTSLVRWLPTRLRTVLIRGGALPDPYHGRATSGSARSFVRLCGEARLSCVSQERIRCGRGPYLLDVISVITRPGSRWDRPLRTIRDGVNHREIQRLAAVYDGTPSPPR